MTKVLIPGSFDPITIGHVDLISRASKLFDKIYVGIMINKNKNYLFSAEERVCLAKKALDEYKNVEVLSSDGLTVDFCKQLNCGIIIKGVRTNNDYEYELNQANINMILDNNIETILLFAKPEYSSISSSNIKDIWKFKGNIKSFIPDVIYDEIVDRLENKNLL